MKLNATIFEILCNRMRVWYDFRQFFVPEFSGNIVHKHPNKSFLVICESPLLNSHILIEVSLAGQDLGFEGVSSLQSVAISHKMMVAMKVDNNIAHKVLIAGFISRYENITHEITDVVLFESSYPCLDEGFIHVQMSFWNLGNQMLLFQMLEKGLEGNIFKRQVCFQQ